MWLVLLGYKPVGATGYLEVNRNTCLLGRLTGKPGGPGSPLSPCNNNTLFEKSNPISHITHDVKVGTCRTYLANCAVGSTFQCWKDNSGRLCGGDFRPPFSGLDSASTQLKPEKDAGVASMWDQDEISSFCLKCSPFSSQWSHLITVTLSLVQLPCLPPLMNTLLLLSS